jgi:hypothetical protein
MSEHTSYPEITALQRTEFRNLGMDDRLFTDGQVPPYFVLVYPDAGSEGGVPTIHAEGPYLREQLLQVLDPDMHIIQSKVAVLTVVGEHIPVEPVVQAMVGLIFRSAETRDGGAVL